LPPVPGEAPSPGDSSDPVPHRFLALRPQADHPWVAVFGESGGEAGGENAVAVRHGKRLASRTVE